MILHHTINGNGPNVVLLHPVGLDLTFFDPLAGHLQDRYRVLRMDQRGHGHSPVAPPARDWDDYVADTRETLAAADFLPAAFAGFSFGGMLVQEYALKHPDDVRALAICACPSTLAPEGRAVAAQRADEAERDGMQAVVEATLERWFTEEFRQGGGAEPARQRLLTDAPSGWAQAWRAIATLDTQPRLGAVRAPAICIAGEHDRASTPAVVEAIASAIPSARYAVIPGVAHMLFIEKPKEVAECISDFFEDVRAGRNAP